MLEHILKFPDYMIKGYNLGKNFKIKGKVDKVIVCGMGGSGVSGYILQDYVKHLPVFVNQDYDIPEFINKKTLAVIISYSGNTEEVISAYEKIKKKTKKKFIISSGGILGKEKNIVKVPQGFPPRYSLPFLFFSMLSVLDNSKIVKKDFDLGEIYENLKSFDHLDARNLARELIGYTPLIYAPQGYGSVAYRWQTQFNENSKVLAHCHVFPEHNHNEIEAVLSNKFKPVMLRDPEAHERVNQRMDSLSDIISAEQIHLKGASKLSKMFYGILFGDFASYYLALERGVDPGQQKRIDDLKEKLKD
ncbi:MAG: bifunctional phosphoglucose/phosphomannose isomerase [Nanoarchaeota archaeon]|nr:bifunctional phosphoglucose/phosphomannose isomerase [Nanoarchaeota archaeon]